MRTIKTIRDYEDLLYNDNRYIFRGHSKECYLLLPGSYRAENDVKG